MKSQIREVLEAAAPSIMAARRSAIAKRMSRNRFWERQNEFARRHYVNGEIRVSSGPFAGLLYINEVVFGAIEPKWLGTYEEELHPIVEKLADGGYATVIDIGSAEGYYSVGLARNLPAAKVLSYEIDKGSRQQQGRLAALNNVENLSLMRRCDHAALEREIQGRTFVLCDIEGAEVTLLDPIKAPRLRQADILLELHEIDRCSFDEAAALFNERFAASHHIEPIRSRARCDLMLGDHLIDAAYLDEWRDPAQSWLWMRALSQDTKIT